MARKQVIEAMKLTKGELQSFERLLAQLQQTKQVSFTGAGGPVAFTPGAALAVAVAKFAYDVYKDYRNSWILGSDKVFEKDLKSMIQQFNKVENGAKADVSLSALKSLRKDIAAAATKLR